MVLTYPLDENGNEMIPMGQPTQLPGSARDSDDDDDLEGDEDAASQSSATTKDKDDNESSARASLRQAEEIYRHERAVEESWSRSLPRMTL